MTDPEKIIIFSKPTTGNPNMDKELDNWGIKLGASVENLDLARRGRPTYLNVSPYPHVFISQELVLLEDQIEIELIKNAMIMMGHGVATDASQENWTFLGTGKRVSETVAAYERISKQTGWPLLDALLVCRKNLQPKNILPVTTVFSTRGIPYIIADSTVTISLSTDREGKTSGIYRPLEGFELIVAEAQKWDRTYLNWWHNYWGHRLNIEDLRKIPNWTRHPAGS